MKHERPFSLDKFRMVLLWSPVGLSLINLWRVIFMDGTYLIQTIIGGAVSIVVALIAVLGTHCSEMKQLKRDGKTIDKISSDTTDMKPKVDATNANVNSMVKDITKIEERTIKIDAIATEVEVFKRMKNDASGASIKPEVLLAHISAILEENADLRQKHQNDQQIILSQDEELTKLRVENRQLQTALNQQTPTPSDDEEWEP